MSEFDPIAHLDFSTPSVDGVRVSTGLNEQTDNAQFQVHLTDAATTIPELRAAVTHHGSRYSSFSIGKKELARVSDATEAALWRVGFDLEDTDPRAVRFSSALKGLRDYIASDRHAGGMVRHPEVFVKYSLLRLLSAADAHSPDRAQLLPQQPLVERVLTHQLQAVALLYTEPNEFTVRHRYPRKAGRTVTDPKSEFWGFQIHTDDFIGKSYGRDGYGPNVSITMPTGRILDASLTEYAKTPSADTGLDAEELKHGVVPAKIHPQAIRLGVADKMHAQLDTTDGQVQQFLDHVATHISSGE
jgi:hypothetical protein